MRRSTFLRFDADGDCDDVTVKHEPAAGGAVGYSPSVKPLHAPPPSSQKRKRDSSAWNGASHASTSAAAAVKAEPASVAIGPRAFKHQCPYCSYGSNISSNIVVHVRVHTGEKPFKVRCRPGRYIVLRYTVVLEQLSPLCGNR